jgi:hypothetical protein
MFVASFEINDMGGVFATFETLFDKRQQDTIVLISAVKESTDVPVMAQD